MNPKVSIVKCKSYDPTLAQAGVKRSLDLLGGITAFIKPKTRVLVKPNLLMAKEPESGICTHPEVVRGVIRLLKDIDCSIYLGDGPSVWGSYAENIDAVYEKTGMLQLAKDEGVTLVKFEKKRWRGKFPLAAFLDECDHLVSIPKLKTHGLTLMTAAIKNLFGLVWNTYKAELHMRHFAQDDFAKILAEVYAESRPSLTVVDAIVSMEGDGPGTSGKLRESGLLLAGYDCVALDSVSALIMGIKPLDVLATREAAKRGLGIAEIGSISVVGERIEEVIGEPFCLPSTSLKRRLPQPIVEIVKKLIHFRPKVNYNNCVRCGACIVSCPNKVISLKSGRIVIDYAKCISCFCCQEVCPNRAIKIKKSFFAKLAGL